MKDYLSSRFKGAEQDVQGQQEMLKSCMQKCLGIKGNRQVMSRRQVQVGGSTGPETVAGAGGYFGGILLP